MCVEKSLKLMLFMFLLLTFPTIIYADSCSESRGEAKKVKVSYELFYDENDIGFFRIKIRNVGDNITVYTDSGEPIKNNQYEVMATDMIQEIKLPVYSKGENCNEPIYEISVRLPLFNDFSLYKICEGIEDYKYCQPLIDEDLNHVQIRERIETFRKQMQDERKLEQLDEKDAFVVSETSENAKLDFVFWILTGVVILLAIVLIVIIIIYKKRKKRMVI